MTALNKVFFLRSKKEGVLFLAYFDHVLPNNETLHFRHNVGDNNNSKHSIKNQCLN